MKKHISLLASLLCLGTTALANSPYISEVYDFMPAPGQFTNTIPEYENGDTQASMNAKCKEYLAGQARGSMVCLGAYGGYIVFGFDHAVANKPGEYDLKIYGNAFAASGRDDGGSAEPGIVMVSYDANGNGIPDDAWYELAGSDYSKSTTFHNYEITYYKPAGSEPDSTYIRWTSNDPADPMGYVERNQFHRQDYWPGWAEGNTLTFRGTRLATTPSGKREATGSTASSTGDTSTTVPTERTPASSSTGQWTPRATPCTSTRCISSKSTPASTRRAGGWAKRPRKSSAPRTCTPSTPESPASSPGIPFACWALPPGSSRLTTALTFP